MEDRNQTDPKLYYDYFNNSDGSILEDQKPQFEYSVSNGSTININGHTGFEFILQSQKNIPQGNEKDAEKDAKRISYWVTILMNGKEYTLNFESEVTKFYKYMPIVRSIVNSFNSINYQEVKRNDGYTNDKNLGISIIREIMANNLMRNAMWKEYTDPNYNFTISYPYIDIFSKPNSIFANNESFTIFLLPSTNYLNHPYKNPVLFVSISNDNLTSTKSSFFRYELLNSSTGYLVDGSPISVYERKYFLPLSYQWVYEKEAIVSLKDKFLTISLVVPFEDSNLYEAVFDNMASSFRFR